MLLPILLFSPTPAHALLYPNLVSGEAVVPCKLQGMHLKDFSVGFCCTRISHLTQPWLILVVGHSIIEDPSRWESLLPKNGIEDQVKRLRLGIKDLVFCL